MYFELLLMILRFIISCFRSFWLLVIDFDTNCLSICNFQDLYSDSQRSDAKVEALNEKLSSPLEVFEPSIPAMNLKLDSAPPDDV